MGIDGQNHLPFVGWGSLSHGSSNPERQLAASAAMAPGWSRECQTVRRAGTRSCAHPPVPARPSLTRAVHPSAQFMYNNVRAPLTHVSSLSVCLCLRQFFMRERCVHTDATRLTRDKIYKFSLNIFLGNKINITYFCCRDTLQTQGKLGDSLQMP